MKQILVSSVLAVATMVALACTGNKQAEAQAQKSLVLYYSQTGTTKLVAEEIQKLTGADIEAIDATEPYDSDFQATIARCQKESADSVLPTIKAIESNMADYDIIYLGYPIWFGTYAPPIASLISDLNLEDKKVVPFCTFGSGGLETSVKDLKAKLPDVEILDGYGVRTARINAMPAEIERYLKENGLIKGEVEALPDYSGQQPVTEAEADIFNAACSGYQFPLGTPVSCGKRTTDASTNYQFTASSQSPDGQQTLTTIYVTVAKGDSAKPEFTKVVR